jgi:hypothetical protein
MTSAYFPFRSCALRVVGPSVTRCTVCSGQWVEQSLDAGAVFSCSYGTAVRSLFCAGTRPCCSCANGDCDDPGHNVRSNILFESVQRFSGWIVRTDNTSVSPVCVHSVHIVQIIIIISYLRIQSVPKKKHFTTTKIIWTSTSTNTKFKVDC